MEVQTLFTFWVTVCNLHKQAHANTHMHNFVYPLYKSFLFSSPDKNHFTGSTFLQGWF